VAYITPWSKPWCKFVAGKYKRWEQKRRPLSTSNKEVILEQALAVISVDETKGEAEAGRNYRGADYVAYVFVFLGSIIMSSVVQTPLRPVPSHSATETQPVRFSVKSFSRSSLAVVVVGGGGDKHFSQPGPKPSRRP
jgi:hypothetical protein